MRRGTAAARADDSGTVLQYLAGIYTHIGWLGVVNGHAMFDVWQPGVGFGNQRCLRVLSASVCGDAPPVCACRSSSCALALVAECNCVYGAASFAGDDGDRAHRLWFGRASRHDRATLDNRDEYFDFGGTANPLGHGGDSLCNGRHLSCDKIR